MILRLSEKIIKIERKKTRPLDYAGAGLSVIFVTLAQSSMVSLLDDGYPLLSFLVMLLLTSCFRKIIPAIFFLFSGFLTSAYFMIHPRHSFMIGYYNGLSLGMYFFLGAASIMALYIMRHPSRKFRKMFLIAIMKHVRRPGSYFIALFSCASATAIRLLLDPFLGHDYPLIFFLIASIAAGWKYGFYPCFLALILGYFSAVFFFIQPRFSFNVSDFNSFYIANYFLLGFGAVFFFSYFARGMRKT